MTDGASNEQVLLDRFEASWKSQGYELLREPSSSELPDFLKKIRPDAVLLGRSPKVVVEVVRKGQPEVERKLNYLKTLLVGHDDWRLEVVYAGVYARPLEPISLEHVIKTLDRVRLLAETEPTGALLLFWGALEATSRILEPEKFKNSQSPLRIVEILASMGHISPAYAALLREAAQLRNRIIHGELDVSISETQIVALVEVADDLISTISARRIN